MSDDTNKRGEENQHWVADNEPYEVSNFAKKHGLSRDRAQMLIDKFGNDRAKLDSEAAKLAKK